MTTILLALSVFLGSPLAALQQDTWSETTFHRVHLRNGNFIDGRVIADKPNEVILLLKAGEMSIRRDQIDEVELMKVRTINEKPIILTPPKAPVTPKSGSTEAPKAPKGTSVASVVEIRRKVEALIKKVQMMPGESKQFPTDEVAALGDDGIDYLVSIFPKMDQTLKTLAVFALIGLKTPKSQALLEGFVVNPNADIRLAAVNASSNLEEADRAKLLRPLSKDPDARIRATALGMMRGIEDRDWYEISCDLINDENRDVRIAAMSNASGLSSKFGQDAYVRALMTALKGSDDQKCDAAVAIGSLGKSENWSVLAGLLNDSEPKVRAAAAQALMTLSAQESGPAILDQMSREQDKWTKIYMAGAVQKLRYGKAIPILIEWMADPEVEVQNIAETALRTMTGENHGRDREKWLTWYNKNR